MRGVGEGCCTVEMDEVIYVYQMGIFVEGQWVLGGFVGKPKKYF